ncbi:PilN domain-containing protein [Shewanella avicenniae]|uniref:PilN domain-containing protein n=1 Tax=Shewanella avicenniae TaxID=2814294 RepID=A0ABX7QPD6_9GAMM|nr:PilN domain-containing protein [Shewanella avicenniae]QSX33249.1 PilN domain-containing protein [Shewanella avicenniae]
MSKTRVNLFSASLLPPKQRLTFTRLAALFGLIILLGAAANGLLWYQNQQLQTQLAQLRTQTQTAEQQRDGLQLKLQQHQADAALQAQVTEQQQELRLKTLLLHELKQREQLKSVGFTEKLQELADVSDGKIWLTRLRFDEQALRFEGYSDKPAEVPAWIGRLSQTESFKGKSFASMTMERGEQQPLAFVLTSELGEATK